MISIPSVNLPYKSVAIALLLSVFFGPLGLLYASFWGGIIMLFLGVIVFSSQLIYTILLFWVFCCIWSVMATERYNKNLIALLIEKKDA